MTILEAKSRANIPANPATRPIAPLICFVIGVFNCYADLPILKRPYVNQPVTVTRANPQLRVTEGQYQSFNRALSLEQVPIGNIDLLLT
jgi:hypothetical protein